MALGSNIARATYKCVKSKGFLFGLGVVGIGVTVAASITGTLMAKDHVENAKTKKIEEAANSGDLEVREDLTKVELFKATWKDFVPVALSAGTTVLIFAKLFSKFSKENKALSGLLAVSEATAQHLETKMIDKLGEKEATKLIGDTKQEVITEHGTTEVKQSDADIKYLTQTGEEIIDFIDPTSLRTFKATKAQVEHAVGNVNVLLTTYGSATMSDFYDNMLMDAGDASDLLGWTLDSITSYTLDVIYGERAGAYVDESGKAYTYLKFNETPRVLTKDELRGIAV